MFGREPEPNADTYAVSLKGVASTLNWHVGKRPGNYEQHLMRTGRAECMADRESKPEADKYAVSLRVVASKLKLHIEKRLANMKTTWCELGELSAWLIGNRNLTPINMDCP